MWLKYCQLIGLNTYELLTNFTISSYHINSIQFNWPYPSSLLVSLSKRVKLLLWQALISIWMKTDIYNKDFAHIRLILKERLRRTRKCLIKWNGRIPEVISRNQMLVTTGQTTSRGILCPTICDYCVGSLSSHTFYEHLSLVRPGRRFRVLIHEDLKV